MAETITTQRLVLRPLRNSDAGPITLHASDRRVARMTAAIPHPYPPGAAEIFIESTLAGRRDGEVWAIDATPQDGEELVGVISYMPESGGLGYWVGPPYWNVGYATEAVTALVMHLFESRALGRIAASVFTDNPASATVLLNAGFREHGPSSIYSAARGETVPSRTFRLERADWAGSLEPDQTAG